MKHLISIFSGYFLYATGPALLAQTLFQDAPAPATRFFEGLSMDQHHLNIHLTIDPETRKVSGWVEIDFAPLNADSLWLDAIDMRIDSVVYQGQSVGYHYNGKRLGVRVKDGKGLQRIRIRYSAQPRRGLYARGWAEGFEFPELWTQGQGLEHRHWIPHQDDQRDKVHWTFSVGFPQGLKLEERGFQLVSSGKRVKVDRDKLEERWTYEQRLPQPSYLLALALGRFEEQNRWARFNTHDLGPAVEPMADDWGTAPKAYRLLAYLRWLETEIPSSYVWDSEFTEVVVDNFRHGAMENTGVVIVGSTNLHSEDHPHPDRTLSEIEVHELAHHWFGNSITAPGGRDFWLHEGFATHFQWKSKRRFEGGWAEWLTRRKSRELLAAQHTKKPFSVQDEEAGSLAFYDRGAWVIGMLEMHLGEEVFRNVLGEWLDSNRFGVVDTEGFERFLSRRSGQDLRPFFEEWVRGRNLPEWVLQKEGNQWILERSSPGCAQWVEVLFWTEAGGWKRERRLFPKGNSKLEMPGDYVLPDPNGRLLAKVVLKGWDWAQWNQQLAGGKWSELAKALDPTVFAIALERSEWDKPAEFDRWIVGPEAASRAAAAVYAMFEQRSTGRVEIIESALARESEPWLALKLSELDMWWEMSHPAARIDRMLSHSGAPVRKAGLRCAMNLSKSNPERKDLLEKGIDRGLSSRDLQEQLVAAQVATLAGREEGLKVLKSLAEPQRDADVRGLALRVLVDLENWDEVTAQTTLADVFDPNPRIASIARRYWKAPPPEALKKAKKLAQNAAKLWTEAQKQAFRQFSSVTL